MSPIRLLSCILMFLFNSDAGIVYANRSACLFHLKEYNLALQDAEIAFTLNYPEELHYKLYERAGRCCLNLGRCQEATKMIKSAIQAIGNSPAWEEHKVVKVKPDLQKLLATIPNKTSCLAQNECKSIIPEVASGSDNYLRNASQKCLLGRNDAEGRLITATEEINPGDAVFVDKAYVSTISPEFYDKYCFQCFTQIRVPVVCSNCTVVSYCSPKCRDTAWDKHHHYECEIINFLNNSKISIVCYLAIRILTQANSMEAISWYDLANSTEEVNNNDKDIQNGETPVKDSNGQYDNNPDLNNFYRSDHTAIFRHMTHSKERNAQDNFQQAIISLFLLFSLKRTNYFQEILETKVKQCATSNELLLDKKDNEELIEIQLGTLIFRFLSLLQFNTHEISTWDCDKKTSVYIGAGLFNTLTLSNHSCVPTLTRYFIGDTVVVCAIRTVRKGEEVTDNYGPVYTEMSIEERQSTLLNAFWFECQCDACKNDWPTFDKIPENYVLQCEFCHERLFNSNYTGALNFQLHCPHCTKTTNTLKVIKSLQELEVKYKEASELIDKGMVDQALKISLHSISSLDKLVMSPCRLHKIWQDTAKTCFQKLGNKSFSTSLQNAKMSS